MEKYSNTIFYFAIVVLIIFVRMRAAPDISSEVYFPSLSSAGEDAAPKGAWGKKL